MYHKKLIKVLQQKLYDKNEFINLQDKFQTLIFSVLSVRTRDKVLIPVFKKYFYNCNKTSLGF